ncbi:VWA domain-containing protein [Cognatitamlana onchidii]|uniref:VWA domain-containing protein n=1 Tax=Cognatitamlana onchidii TaxID=2562860 RepID=UPI0010A68CCB|nr:VWA domain-containing protein [Algibacter onchidii]
MTQNIEHINWENFHFLRIEYLYLGIGTVLVLIIGFLFYRESNAWKKNIAPHLRPYVIKKGTSWKAYLIRASVILMFIIGIISFLGPTWNQIKAPAKKVESQFVIALDLSKSMLAEDVSPNRLERAKFKIRDLLEAGPRAATNLLVYAGSAHTAIPFTTDYKIILDQLDGLQPKMMPAQGTEYNGLFKKMDALFDENKAQGKILLVTDDLEDLSLEQVSVFLQDNNVQLFIYPLASQSGAKIPTTKQNSALNISKLKALSEMEALDILEITLDDSDVKDLAKAISDDLVFEDQTNQEEEDWQDNGYWLIFPLAFIFMFSFRKGWSINLIILALFLQSCTKNTTKETTKFKFKDLWYTKAYQAQQDYDSENYLKAASGFDDPMHKGVAYYKGGDFLSAESAFKKDTTINGLYNLGLTYAKLGKLDASQAVFEKVLQKDPSNEKASSNLKQIITAKDKMASQQEESNIKNDKKAAKNKQNKSPEDLSGGGQEATKKDMEKERLEETAETDKRKGKEMDELPDDFKSGKGELPKNILMRKVDDDPALFLTRKFKYQVKKGIVEVQKTEASW